MNPYVCVSRFLVVSDGRAEGGGMRELISPRTGTMRSLKEGMRCDVYAFVAKRTFLAVIVPLGVCTAHRESDNGWT